VADDLRETARRLGLPENDPAVMRDLEAIASHPGQPRPIRERRANRLAVFALFCAFLVPVLGIVFGVVALQEIEASGEAERGARMAEWAVGIGCVVVGFAAAALVWLGLQL